MLLLFKKTYRKHLFFNNFVLLFSFLIFLFVPQLYAGWFITELQGDGFGNLSSQSMFIEGSKIRIENAQQAIVVDTKKNELTLIFFAKKVFWKGDADTLKQKLYDLMQQKIMQLIVQLPQEEQDLAQKELNEQLKLRNASENTIDLATNFVVCDTVEVEILNYPVSIFDFYCDSTLIERIWLTDQIYPFDEIDREKMEQMMQIFSPPTPINLCRSTKGYKDFVQSKFVLKSEISTSYGKSITEVENLRNMSIPEHIFTVPEDYRSILFEELGMLLFDDEKPVDHSNEPFQNLFDDSKFDDW